MYQAVDQIKGNIIHSEYDTFEDALIACYEIALEQASADEVADIEVYERGWREEDGSGEWEAGACPKGDTGYGWPYVISD